jgi:hypothetical protein
MDFENVYNSITEEKEEKEELEEELRKKKRN